MPLAINSVICNTKLLQIPGMGFLQYLVMKVEITKDSYGVKLFMTNSPKRDAVPGHDGIICFDYLAYQIHRPFCCLPDPCWCRMYTYIYIYIHKPNKLKTFKFGADESTAGPRS